MHACFANPTHSQWTPGSRSVSQGYGLRIRILLSSSKNSKKNLDSYFFVTSGWLLIFELMWMYLQKVLSKKNVGKISIISIEKLCRVFVSRLFSRQSLGTRTKQHSHQVSHIYSTTVHVYCLQTYRIISTCLFDCTFICMFV